MSDVLLLFRELITIYFDNCTKSISILFRFCNIKAGSEHNNHCVTGLKTAQGAGGINK
jgi:hypothetical protein